MFESELPGLAFSRLKPQNWPFFKLVGLEVFENLLSSWPYLKSIEVQIVKSNIFPLLKQSLTFYSYKHSGNSGSNVWRKSTPPPKPAYTPS